MSVLFKVENRVVIPNTETLLISPFKEIWERDTSEGKEVAMAEFKYIEFTTSMLASNPYAGYDEETKVQKVIDACIFMEDWKPDELVIGAQKEMEKFNTEASSSYTYYMSAKIAAEKMKDFFNTFDMNEVNTKTMNPVYKPRDITSALKDTSDVLQRLDTMKKKVEEELFQVVKRRGEKVISPFADPSNM